MEEQFDIRQWGLREKRAAGEALTLLAGGFTPEGFEVEGAAPVLLGDRIFVTNSSDQLLRVHRDRLDWWLTLDDGSDGFPEDVWHSLMDDWGDNDELVGAHFRPGAQLVADRLNRYVWPDVVPDLLEPLADFYDWELDGETAIEVDPLDNGDIGLVVRRDDDWVVWSS